jgi:membrane-bound lytic murein transglycosylase B
MISRKIFDFGNSKYTLVVLVLIFCHLCTYDISYNTNGIKQELKYKIFKNVIDTLLKFGVDSELVFAVINDYRTHFDVKFVRINVLPSQKTEFEATIDKSSFKKIKRFIAENGGILSEVESKFGVPREIIAIILWEETKFGNVLGKYHIPSILLSMATAMSSMVINNAIEGNNSTSDSLFKVIEQRARNKANFAINELLSLFEVQRRRMIDVRNLYGSFSGAFGIPQFLPSSYLKYGYDGNGDGRIDLYNMEDAIYSVANFLIQNGWRSSDTATYSSTLFKYNRSKKYVETILYAYKHLKSERTN